MGEAALVSSRYSVCRWIFFQRDHHRTSPFSNLFKIPLHLELIFVISECFISECSVFLFFFFLYFNLRDTPSFAIFKVEIPIFHMIPPPQRHTHTHARIFKPCAVLRYIPSSLSTKYTLATELLNC